MGLFCGLLAVIFTENMGLTLAGGALPWGRWPLTIHSAGWGIAINILVTVIVSYMTQDERARAHRQTFHDFLQSHAGLTGAKKALVPVGWALVLFWLIMGIGPGAVIGNDIFGAPDAGIEGWMFGIPSIWAWQLLFWAIGVVMMFFLAYVLEMSTIPRKEVEAVIEEYKHGSRPAAAE